jgi:Ca2+-binding RTX toxin-like protein
MSAVYLTTLGALWAGSGVNINAVEVGEDGWIYLAGIDRSDESDALAVLAYKDGDLAWSRSFRQDGVGTLYALKYINGSVYAAGEISVNFNGADLAVEGGAAVLAPAGKPAVDPNLAALYPSLYQGSTYPLYVQLDAETGALTQAHVLPSPNVQAQDTLRAIDVDSLGNVYVGGGGWNPGPDPTDKFNGADFYWHVSKFSDVGVQQWELDGAEHVVLDPYSGIPSLTRWGNQIVTVDPETGTDLNTFYFTSPYVSGGVGSWSRGWIFDEDGNIYLLASRWNEANSVQYGTVTKVDQATGNVVWAKDIGLTSEYCMPNSLTFDPSGNLLVGGMSRGTLEGIAGFGGTDGFLIGISADDGSILTKEVIGGTGNESIEQVAFQPVFDQDGVMISQNLIIGGAFAVGRYSLEGRDQKDIYVITDQGFELMGNDLDNYIQGGGGNDSIASGVGDDTLVGGSGNDTIAGGVGKDLIVAGNGAGDDRYDGGEGIDTVRYTSATAGLTINLAAAQDQARSTQAGDLAGIGTDQLSNIENIIAGYYDDIITGNAADNVIAGMTGNDIIDGGAGFDTVEIASAFADVSGVAYASDGRGVVVTSAQGRDSMINVERVQFLDAEYTPEQLMSLLPISAEFSISNGSTSSGVSPTLYTGPASLNLQYQLINTTPGAIIGGSALNDFIVLQGGGNKAVNGGLGDDVIDGGTGSTFVSGGGGSNTFFLDGRAPGVSWSTITDFQFGQDKATIWGWKEGVSRVKEVVENGGASGFTGLTLHFENLLPDGSSSSARNSSLNSITFSRMSLSDFGVESVDELNQQILSGSNSYFIVGQTTDVYGEHGYLYIG